MASGYDALTEKEKATLRLIVRGHDAKSVARHLSLSVYTINERLRDARRKLAVSSSREAARLVLDREGVPDRVVDNAIGDAAAVKDDDWGASPAFGDGPAHRLPFILIGAAVMSLIIGLLVVAAAPQSAPTVQTAAPTAAGETIDAEVVATARRWLALLDESRWDDSWAATARSFRALNTRQVWAAASLKARAPLGAALARTLLSQENLPAPPHGYEVVKFRTRFANRADAVETVSLDREDGAWRVVGVTIG